MPGGYRRHVVVVDPAHPLGHVDLRSVRVVRVEQVVLPHVVADALDQGDADPGGEAVQRGAVFDVATGEPGKPRPAGLPRNSASSSRCGGGEQRVLGRLLRAPGEGPPCSTPSVLLTVAYCPAVRGSRGRTRWIPAVRSRAAVETDEFAWHIRAGRQASSTAHGMTAVCTAPSWARALPPPRRRGDAGPLRLPRVPRARRLPGVAAPAGARPAHRRSRLGGAQSRGAGLPLTAWEDDLAGSPASRACPGASSTST